MIAVGACRRAGLVGSATRSHAESAQLGVMLVNRTRQIFGSSGGSSVPSAEKCDRAELGQKLEPRLRLGAPRGRGSCRQHHLRFG